MFTDDITSEVEDLFTEFQGAFEGDLKKELTLGIRQGVGLREMSRENFNSGFRCFNPNPPKTPERLAQIRRSVAAVAKRDIHDRLRAGERPKKWGKRWVAAAKELGIPVPPPTGRNIRKSWVAPIADQLLTAGTPGGAA